MKNFKIYKSALAVVTSASILLLSGCSSNTNKKEENEQLIPKSCQHLTIYFEDKPITFKECEGYEIDVEYLSYKSRIHYAVEQDGKEIISGATAIFNAFDVNHDNADEIIEHPSIQKVK